ncbi:MAG TPA: hypothetical protein VG125_26950 [Pirellulales bacterium]|jgi:hypothetical protein|nr:hypothetical protein [Pirellulales bacterium]
MVSTFTYDARRKPTPSAVNAAGCVATVAFWNNDGERGIVYAPSDGPPLIETLLARLRAVYASDTRWGTYWQFLARHPWSVCRWELAGLFVAYQYRLPKGSDDEVIQAGQLRLCVVLEAEPDVRAWIETHEEHFAGWLAKLFFNCCRTAARKLARQRRFAARGGSDSSAELSNLIDPHADGSEAILNEMLAKLEEYPEKVQAVLLLLSEGHVWREIAETLGISPGAARWALRGHADKLRGDFESFR